jgi:nucleoid-associated protein YgaU
MLRAVGRRTVLIMKSFSILKLIVSALVLVAVCGAVLIFDVTKLQREDRLQTAAVTAAPSPTNPSSPTNQTNPTNPSKPDVKSESSSALATTEAKVAAFAAELALPPSMPATDPSVPSFDVARVEDAGEAVIAGRAAPGAVVELLRGSERLDRAVADASGQFVMVPQRLPAGSYELTLSAKLPDGTVTPSNQRVTVAVNDQGGNSGRPRTELVPETAPQARPSSQPSSQPSLQPAKPQESAALQHARAAIAANSAPEEGVARSGVAPRILTKIVSRGDSLWRISRIAYGNGTQYAIVYRANRDRILNPNLIHPGQVLVLPTKRH